MRKKLAIRSLIFSLQLLVLNLITPVSLVQAAPNITHGPVSQYKFKAEASWMIGKINLRWYNDGSADKFALLYGSKIGQYKFGAVNLPATAYEVNKFTVGYLASDRYYYFALIAEKNGQFVYMTEPVMALTN